MDWSFQVTQESSLALRTGGVALVAHHVDATFGDVTITALGPGPSSAGGTAPAVLNAANEVAVAAFLEGRLPFPAIADVVEEAIDAAGGAPARDLTELVEADGTASLGIARCSRSA